MVQRVNYVDGEPCWADVMARDPEAARAFYQRVFGWSWEVSGAEHGGYALAMSDGVPVAGMTP